MSVLFRYMQKKTFFDVLKTCFHLYQNNPTCSARILKRHEILATIFHFSHFFNHQKVDFHTKMFAGYT